MDCFVEAGSELQRTQVGPEGDAFTFWKIASHTGVTVQENNLSLRAVCVRDTLDAANAAAIVCRCALKSCDWELECNQQSDGFPLTSFAAVFAVHLFALLFVLLGLFVPMFSMSHSEILSVTLMAIAISLVVEISKLLNGRATDIDDLIMNVAGALIGYVAFRVIDWTRKSYEATGMVIATAMITAAFFGRFFLYDEMGLAKVLFGF